MILTHFLKVCAYVLGFFLLGLGFLTLDFLKDFLQIYRISIFDTLLLAIRVFLACLIWRTGWIFWLSIERRIIENNFFAESGFEVLPPMGEEENFSQCEKMDLPSQIIEAYNTLLSQDETPSLSKIAISVFGQKGGAYTNQVKQVLAAEEIFL